jgi:hypothetical protein
VTPACGGDDDDNASGGNKATGGAKSTTGGTSSSGGNATGGTSGGVSAKGGTGGASSSGGSAGGTVIGGQGGESGGVPGASGGEGGGLTAGQGGEPPMSTGGSGGEGGPEGGGGGEGGEPVVNLDPVGLRPVGATLTDYVARSATLGGTAYYDICPRDQVLVGFKYHNYSDFVNGLTAICGTLTLAPEEGNLLQIEPGMVFPERGGLAPVDGGEALCPANQVVVGFEGYYNDWLRKITLSCASIDVVNHDGTTEIVVGAPTPLPEFGKASDPPPIAFPYTGCPAGQLARGAQIDAGAWLEALGLECATPTLTYGKGAPCTVAADCAGASTCDAGTCKALPCNAAPGCSCQQLEDKQYVFCPAAADSTYANAGFYCSEQDRRLAWAKTGFVTGWLHSTASLSGLSGGFWIGADDLTTPGTFTWANSGGAVTFTDWYEGQPKAGEHCVLISDGGAWYSSACAASLGYACE